MERFYNFSADLSILPMASGTASCSEATMNASSVRRTSSTFSEMSAAFLPSHRRSFPAAPSTIGSGWMDMPLSAASRVVKKLERSVPGQFRNPPSASPGRLNPAVVSGYSVHFYG